MKIRNERVIKKLTKNATDTITPEQQLKEEIKELNEAFELDTSISSYLSKMLSKATSIIGLAFILNFAALYFFDVGIEVTDYDSIFFLFSLLAISIIGEIIYSLQLRRVMSSSLSVDEKLDAVKNKKLFKGFSFFLVLVGIVISLIGALYNFIYFIDDYSSFEDGYFFNIILYVIIFVTLYEYIKEGLLFPAIIIVVLAGLVMTYDSYLIDYIQQSHRPFEQAIITDTQKELILGSHATCDDASICPKQKTELIK
jgi:hypothetical protein